MAGEFDYDSLPQFVTVAKEMYVSTLFAIVSRFMREFELERKGVSKK